MRNPALLALADGSLFHGESIGADGHAQGEVVFNTAMSGYQEILTDPSYCRQIITLTYPHIGNVGTNSGDEEAAQIYASGLIVRDCPHPPSNWRSQQSLPDYLRERGIIALAGIDTRRLTRWLREHGAQSACIMAGHIDVEQALHLARSFPGLQGMDLAQVVSTTQPYTWEQGNWRLASNDFAQPERGRWHVVVYDYGVKRSMLRMLVERGCRVTVVPAQTPASAVLQLAPNGVFLSNGPGDPEPCNYAIAAIRELLERGMPMFGICLGHQLLGLAGGAQTVKMKFGHHGGNHPVQELATGQVMISSQNHGFAVDEASLPPTLRPTHRSLFDGSLQGLEHRTRPAFSFQGHPEASPGPHDVSALFDHFVSLMANHQPPQA